MIEVLKDNNGAPMPKEGDEVTIHYVAMAKDGTPLYPNYGDTRHPLLPAAQRARSGLEESRQRETEEEGEQRIRRIEAGQRARQGSAAT